ncbi:MAG: DNA polymerase III subunit chi [Pseudomonadota bacterium]
MLFYHLTARPLERVLPDLLTRTLARGWRAVLRAGEAGRIPALDSLLWTFDEASFLAHGTPATPMPEAQPIYLTAGREVPNGADVLFLVEGARVAAEEIPAFTRTVLLFDGRDPEATEAARADWRSVAAAEGAQAVYWAEEDGRWIKRAESG